MKVLIDTNIILDVLLKRAPFYEDGICIMKMGDKIEKFISASAVTDIYYIANRNLKDKAVVKKLLQNLLKIVSVATVSEKEIQYALELEWSDFEDSVQYAVAQIQDMDGVITRNADDYSHSEIPVWLPGEFLKKYQIS